MADARETAGRRLCVKALAIAIDTTVDEEARWYVSTNALELVCLDLCLACRSCWNIPPRKVVVAADTPSRVWLRGKSSGALRVPPLPVRAVMVKEWPEGVLAGLLEGQHRVSATTTGRIVKRRIVRLVLPKREPLWWPASLKKLSFDGSFNRSIAKVVWPASLEELSFGWRFNLPIAGVVWPASLQQIKFGWEFNQPISGVLWPASLLHIIFGWSFNQPITGVLWPASLQQLSFGWSFNQPIVGVVWPASLEQLSFGEHFNQPITGVVWPASFQRLWFGRNFIQPTAGVVYPAALRRVNRDGLSLR